MASRFEFVDLGIQRREETVSADVNFRHDVPLGLTIDRRPDKPGRATSAPQAVTSHSLVSTWNNYRPSGEQRDVEAEALGTINGGHLRRLRQGVNNVGEAVTSKGEVKTAPNYVHRSAVVIQAASNKSKKKNVKAQPQVQPQAQKPFKEAPKSRKENKSSRPAPTLVCPRAPRPRYATLNYSVEPPRTLPPGERLTHPINDYLSAANRAPAAAESTQLAAIQQTPQGQFLSESTHEATRRSTAALQSSASDGGESCPMLTDDSSTDSDIAITLQQVDKICSGLEGAFDLAAHKSRPINLNRHSATRPLDTAASSADELSNAWNKLAKDAAVAKDARQTLVHGKNFHQTCADRRCTMAVVPAKVQNSYMKMRKYFSELTVTGSTGDEGQEDGNGEHATEKETVTGHGKGKKAEETSKPGKSCIGGNLKTSKWAS